MLQTESQVSTSYLSDIGRLNEIEFITPSEYDSIEAVNDAGQVDTLRAKLADLALEQDSQDIDSRISRFQGTIANRVMQLTNIDIEN